MQTHSYKILFNGSALFDFWYIFGVCLFIHSIVLQHFCLEEKYSMKERINLGLNQGWAKRSL